MARKRSKSGFKKGKHGSKRDIFEDIDEEAIRKDLRESVHQKEREKSSKFSFVILVLVIVGIIGCGVLYVFVIDTDVNTPWSSPNDEGNKETYGVTLEIVSKKGGDGDHKPYGYSIHKVDPSVGTQYILLLKNTGSGADSFVLSSDAPSGWNVDFQGENEVKDIPRNEWMYKIVTIRVSSSVSEPSREITITATSKEDSTAQDTVITKNTVVAHPPGTANLDVHPAKVDYNLVYYGGGKEENRNGWYHNQGDEFEAEDNSVIVGFEEAIKGMREGQTKVVEVPPEKGYGANDEKHVGGRPLVFEITILDINTGG